MEEYICFPFVCKKVFIILMQLVNIYAKSFEYISQLYDRLV